MNKSDILRIISLFTILLIIGGFITLARTDEGLVLYLPMDENTGSFASDQSGNNNHGTIYGAIWTTGKVGSALNFDGNDSYVDCGIDSSFDITSAITIEAWVYVYGANKDQYQELVAKWHKNDGNAFAYLLELRPDGRTVQFQPNIAGVGIRSAVSSTFINFNEWIFIVGTYDGSTIRVYVNGVETGSNSVSGSIAQSDAPLIIGAHNHTLHKNVLNGKIDEIRIYNRALSVSEIQDHYDNLGSSTTVSQSASSSVDIWRELERLGLVIAIISGTIAILGAILGAIIVIIKWLISRKENN
ncbi:MAG: LamG domain-containing protein [Promethearchaeota archaeon]